MNDDKSLFAELSYLTLLSVESKIDKPSLERLNMLLQTNPQARSIYLELINVHLGLESEDALLGIGKGRNRPGFDNTVLEALAEYEKMAPVLDLPKEDTQGELLQRVVHPPKEKQKLNKLTIFTFINIAAVVLFFVLLRFAPTKGGIEVATLEDSIDAKWGSNTAFFAKGARMSTGNESILLREGYAEVLFDTNARVVIEAPAEFQIIAEDRISLNYGKIYSQVPKEAVGFSVYTPNSKIIDLGTEFGVEAALGGETQLHVIQGKTKLIAGEQSDTTSIEVTEGQATEISATTSAIVPISCKSDLFVRKIDSTVGLLWKGQKEMNLADIVGGGNGFGTGKIDSGIETNTGQRFLSPDPALVQSKIAGILNGGGSYNKVSDLDLIDGVFVPDSRQGPVQITSSGHTFDGFAYGREVFWGNIFNGAWHASDQSIKHQLKLNGRTYGIPGSPAISLHSSQGITFDLQAIRRTIPGGKILRFTSLFGVSETLAQVPSFDPNGDLNTGKVNCWVLIDGKERFNQNSVTYQQGGIEINIDISDKDRFLTLVVTESDDRRAYDWALFADPYLMIQMDMN